MFIKIDKQLHFFKGTVTEIETGEKWYGGKE